MGLAPIQAGQRITAAVANSLPVSLAQLVTGSVADSTAETIVGTFNIPADNVVQGSGYSFHIVGNAYDTGTPSITLRLRINSVTGTLIGNALGPFVCRANQADMIWAWDGNLYATSGGASANLQGNVTLTESIVSTTPAVHGNPTYGNAPAAFNSTAQWSLVVTAQWTAAAAANIASTIAGSLYPV